MSQILGEFMGTAVLVLFGNGVVANVCLNKSKGNNSGWIVITAGWAFAVLAGVFAAIAFGSADAHINPAVTLAFAFTSGDYSKIATYVPAQFAGAMVGAVLVWLAYLPHWSATQDAGLKLASFSTGPAIRQTLGNLLAEIIATAALVLVVGSIFSKAVSPTGPAPGIGPFLVAGLVWGIGLSLGGPTGYAVNPARDLGPRIAYALLPISGKDSADWGYAWIPVVGPLLGGVVAAVLLRLIA